MPSIEEHEKAAKELIEDIEENLVNIEELRNRLCYGRDKEAKEVNEAVKFLFELKKLLEEQDA